MSSNVGGIDRILRIIIGLALIGATVAGLLPVWGYIGAVPLPTLTCIGPLSPCSLLAPLSLVSALRK